MAIGILEIIIRKFAFGTTVSEDRDAISRVGNAISNMDEDVCTFAKYRGRLRIMGDVQHK